ncbi:serine/threonine protein kinase [Actinoplanes sp. LDG1-01]|uniref:Serine/threonine protein kinase n=2 Tax=Paractinoplanes lichenicola TaxID=2802976 RepID=A0ABS1W4X2_9ACTN|nr:serine/threonine protein kinase [Actinoplanes lichenicola]
MGVVYEARARDGRRVAVKVIHAQLAGNDGFRARFRSEVARARQVPPFCTAEVLDADPDAAQPYLVVEFVDGPSLAEEIQRRGPLSPANLHGLAIGVATALAAIHEAGVIHRDLKPQNVLLAPGSPKVIDFGIARALEPTTQHTRTGEIVGSINYMAPERFGAIADAVTPATDVFAWGCVVAYAAQGHPPFDADSAVGVFGRIMGGTPTLDGLTGPLRNLVEQALSASPQLRPTARDLIQTLIGPDGDGTAVVRDVLEQRAAVGRARHARPRRAFLATAVILVLALAGGLGFALRARNTNSDQTSASPSSTGSDTTLVLPSGILAISNPLVTDGEWEPSSVQGGQTYCRFTNDGLKIQNQDPGIWRCSGPDRQVKGIYSVEATGHLDRPGSCLGIWFASTPATRYRLDVCPSVWQLHAEEEASGDSTVLQQWNVASSTQLHPQIVVENDTVRVGHDGILLGQQPLNEPDLTGGPFDLGVVSTPNTKKGPYGVTFTHIEVRVAG